MKKVNKEMFEESLRQYLNGITTLTDAANMCGISRQLWMYRAQIYCERGGLDESYWEHTSLDDKQKEEDKFFNSLSEDYEERTIDIPKEEKCNKWQLSNFKNM